jgi:nucleotide-binding universal stress UspA family protein
LVTAGQNAPSTRRARILAYIEPEARNASLLDLLERLARTWNANVLALRVLRELPWYVRGSQAKRIRKALEHKASADLEREVEPLLRAGLGVRTRVAWGRPFEVIIREALRHPTQLVMKTAHAERHGEAPLFGSTARHLFRKCPVPVWVVKPRRARRIRRVLAAIDPVEPTPDEVDLNPEILQAALDIASSEGAELHVCHAFWSLTEHVLPKESQPAVSEFRARAREAMARLLSPFELSVDDPRVHILDGDAGQVIPGFATKERIDLLVMGTIARAGVPGLLIGNTAERILQAVDCSVLAIKPRDFVSPVRLPMPSGGSS